MKSACCMLISAALLMAIAPVVADTGAAAGCAQSDQNVEALSLSEPWYPHSAMAYCLTGAVTVEFTVGTDGTTGNIQITDSDPAGLFDASVLQTIETIEVELPADSGTTCSQNMASLDEEAGRLFDEVAVRYALMAEVYQEHFPGTALANELVKPLTGFTGDLGAVADLHEAAFARMHDIIENSHGHVHLSAVMRDLHPVMLARDVDLAGLNASIDQLRQSLRQFEEMVTAFNRQLESDYRSIRDKGHLEKSQLDLLIKPFLGDPEAQPEDNTPGGYRHIMNLVEQLVALLEENSGDWQVDDETVQFGDEARQNAWDEGNRALQEALDLQQEMISRGLQSYLDYAS